ncbi:MAG: transcription elongation factor GreA [Elusimicrobiota bacterium]
MAKQSYLTKEGYRKLCDELDRLKKRKPALQEEIARAREHGDLRENAEYHAAKESLTNLQRRIMELDTKLSNSAIIDNSQMEKDKVYIGATVSLLDVDSADEFSYTIVDVEEADLAVGKISMQSPLAQGLMGHKTGETVTVDLPAGPLKLKILKINR